MDKITLPGGAIEYRDTADEKASKEKYKAKKKAADLTNKDMQELIYKLAKLANLL